MSHNVIAALEVADAGRKGPRGSLPGLSVWKEGFDEDETDEGLKQGPASILCARAARASGLTSTTSSASSARPHCMLPRE